MAAASHPVVLFDGVCNLCNASVNAVIDRDPDGRFHFASLQSPAARSLLAGLGAQPPPRDPDSVLLVQDGHVYRESTAALRIARQLRGPSRLLGAFLVVPRPLRDVIYRFVARHRYGWFGKAEACRVPTPDLAARFLDA
jgi:predicted DCC family thiol-disulfide oxidoreductase YuxK